MTPATTPGRTDRLNLRAWRPDEAPRLFDILSRMDVVKWLGDDDPQPMTDVAEAEARIASWAQRNAEDPRLGVWAVEVLDTGAVAGSVLTSPLPNAVDGEIEIGWHFHPDAQGHGYATEAARRLVEHTLAQGFPEVYAVTHTTNGPSQAVCRRLGMRDLGEVEGLWYAGESHLFVAEAAS